MVTIFQILTWRFLALLVIPVICGASLVDLPIRFIVSFGFCGVIASVLSLRGQEGDS